VKVSHRYHYHVTVPLQPPCMP